jgi:hypothetical protein
MGDGVRTPATTSSPCALIRYSPISFLAPVAGLRVKATPVPEVVAGVAEDHLLHVDGGAPVVGDVVHAAVDVGAGVVPGAEHGLDGLDQLTLRVLRERLALVVLIDLLEGTDQLLQILGGQVDVVLDALGFLHLVDLAPRTGSWKRP